MRFFQNPITEGGDLCGQYLVALLRAKDEHAEVFLRFALRRYGCKKKVPHKLKVAVAEGADLRGSLLSEYLGLKPLPSEIPIQTRAVPAVWDGIERRVPRRSQCA